MFNPYLPKVFSQFVTTTSQFTLSESNGLVYKLHPRFLAQNLGKKVRLIHESLRWLALPNVSYLNIIRCCLDFRANENAVCCLTETLIGLVTHSFPKNICSMDWSLLFAGRLMCMSHLHIRSYTCAEAKCTLRARRNMPKIWFQEWEICLLQPTFAVCRIHRVPLTSASSNVFWHVHWLFARSITTNYGVIHEFSC